MLMRFLQSWTSNIVNRRLPAANNVHLDQAKLFIFPSKAGFGFLVLIILLWLLGTNYQNNIIIAITFFLVSLFVTAILHSFANLVGLSVSCLGAPAVFLGQQAQFEISVSRRGKRTRQGITLSYKQADAEQTDLLSNSESRVLLSCKPSHRGWFDPGRISIQSCYPLGLFKVWTHLDLASQVVVYPKPIFAAHQHGSSPVGGAGIIQQSTGSDDFTGFKDYQIGQPLQHVAWKHFARERGFLSKQYADSIDQQLWIDWQSYPNLEREARLSRLCGMLLDICDDDCEYGLKLPGVELPMGRGENHKQQILFELAIFELPDRARILP